MMSHNNQKLKELPKDIKFATFNSDNEDIVLDEYLIAILIYNGESLNQILESANQIKNRKERKIVKNIISKTILDFISVNPKYNYLLIHNEIPYFKMMHYRS